MQQCIQILLAQWFYFNKILQRTIHHVPKIDIVHDMELLEYVVSQFIESFNWILKLLNNKICIN